MVTRDDLPLEMFPAESCCNCGFLSKFVCDSDGNNERSNVPITSQYERFHGPEEHNDELWQGRRIAQVQCWMRRGFLEREAPGGHSRVPHVPERTLEGIHKDRSEQAGSDYCLQFTVWVPHLNFEQHWEERKLYLAERDRKNFEERLAGANRDLQKDIHGQTMWVLFAQAAISVIAIVAGMFATARWGDTTVIPQPPQVIIVQATPTAQAPSPAQVPSPMSPGSGP
jgi:hypothetical protein